jgi:hypothetical protein
MTIVGVPLAYELEKSKQREVFVSCMTARGYAVRPVGESAVSASAPPAQARVIPVRESIPPAQPLRDELAVVPPRVMHTTSVVAREVKDETAQLQKLMELRDKGLITENEYSRKRQEILDKL